MPQISEARRFAQGEVPTSPGVVYTVGTVQRVILSAVSFTNSGSLPVVLDMWIVPSGGSRANSNKCLHEELIVGQTYRESGMGMVLEPGDTIHLGTDQAGLSYFLSGAELTTI